jgi:predicted transcriptional regulator
MGKYRSRSRIICDLLRCINDEQPGSITRLISAANTTHARIQDQLGHFLDHGLAVQADDATWALTDKGMEALTELRRIETAMRDFGLNL